MSRDTAMDSFQIVLDGLKGFQSEGKWDQLLVQLRFLKTFYMCGKKWGKGGDFESILLRIEETVEKYSQEFQPTNLRWNNHLQKVVSQFVVTIQESFLQEMEQLYRILLDGSSPTAPSSQEVKLVDIMDSLLHNLQDLLQHKNFGTDLSIPIEDLKEYVRFLKNFFLFVSFSGLEHRLMEQLLNHIEDLVATVARLTFISWHNNYRKIWHKVYQLIERRIKPTEAHVCGIYVAVLQASESSWSFDLPTPPSPRLMLGDFVNSLLFLLQQLSFASKDIFNHEIQRVGEELSFLTTFLKEQPGEFEFDDGLFELIGVVICKAGIVICSLFAKENEGGSAEKFEPLFKDFLESFKLIKAKVGTQKYPLTSASDFPQTNVLVFIDSLLERMKSESPNCEADSFSWAKDDRFQTIQEDMVRLRSFLSVVMEKSDEIEKLQGLRSRIVAVCYQTEFLLDSLVAADTLQSLVFLLNTIEEEIKLIMTEVSKPLLYGQRQVTKVERIANIYSSMPSVSDEFIVGLDDEARKIIDGLTTGTRQLDIISIVGMGGLGKTTLANRVYNHPDIVSSFHVRAWCTVSQLYSRRNLLLDILRGGLTTDRSFNKYLEMGEGELAEILYRMLKRRRYLIVLDDVWGIEAWNSLRISFPDDHRGSRILLTSRIRDVALQIKPNSEPYSLRSLTNYESWELLRNKLRLQSLPPYLIELGMEIAQSCKGLPLRIQTVAGLLSTMETIEAWENVAKGLREGTLSASAQEILGVSYHHLPEFLKPCFLYFGSFKEEQQIPVRELVQLWIAEGFVPKTEEECLEEVAEGYLRILIERSLVMIDKISPSTGRVKSCVLHDLIHELCKAKCKEENFLHFLHGNNVDTSIDPSILYRLCVHLKDSTELRQLFPRLHSLRFMVDYGTRNEQKGYNILYKLCQSRLLRVLDIRSISLGPFFPRIIESLVQLRYLAFLALAIASEGTKVAIPPSIGKLSNLQTFLVQHEESLPLHAWLPDTLFNLTKLRYLRITGAFACWKFPDKNLEDRPILEDFSTVSTVEFSCGHLMEKFMRKFPNIRRLKCKLVRAGSCTGECKRVALDFLHQLESLAISQIREEFHDVHFQFPSNLKKLVLSNLQFPWSKISAIGELPNLEALKLLDNAFKGEIWDMEEEEFFLRLRFLKLVDLDLVSWIALDESFPSLEKLILEDCYDLVDLPSFLACTLQTIEVSNCESAASAIQNIRETQIGWGNDPKILIR